MTAPPRAAKHLEPALLFTILVHALGMLTMAAFLLPGMPGGPHLDVASRTAYVASHPWIWRIGWLGWQLTALSDLLLGIALMLTPWISKLPAFLTLLATVLAMIPDQCSQALWTWHGIDLAQRDPSAYAAFESHVFRLIAGYATIGYLTAALGWTWAFASAGTWNRSLTRLSIATWGLFAISTAPIFLPQLLHPPGYLTAAGNAIAFVLLMIWLIAVTESVLRRSRPDTINGHWANWRYPSPGTLPRLIDLFANSRFVRFIGEHLHAFAMSSDITDVIYINYLVPADKLEPLVPPGLRMQRIGPDYGWALFSILTYRHGHFGPTFFGPLRRLWPSPLQSNWRIYVVDPNTNQTGVHFITTAITSTPHALATRLLSEGVPMHVPKAAGIHRDESGTIHITIDAGPGTAPDLHGTFDSTEIAALPDSWKCGFDSWTQMLAYCVPQDRALAPQPWYGRMARQEISLGIPLADCKPVAGEVHSRAAENIVGSAQPLCFKVDRVPFRFLGEAFDRSGS